VQAEQVRQGPTENLGLLAPFGNEAATILDRPLPVGRIDVSRTAMFEFFEATT
jgi:hypothetical protein